MELPKKIMPVKETTMTDPERIVDSTVPHVLIVAGFIFLGVFFSGVQGCLERRYTLNAEMDATQRKQYTQIVELCQGDAECLRAARELW